LARNDSIQPVGFYDLMNLGFVVPEHWKRAASEYSKTVTGHAKYHEIAESA